MPALQESVLIVEPVADCLVRLKGREPRDNNTADSGVSTVALRTSIAPDTSTARRLGRRLSISRGTVSALSDITERAVLERYLERGKVSKARADNAARVLRAVFNFARATYRRSDGSSLFAINPTTILSDAKVRYRIPRRRTTIASTDLADWWLAVQELANRTASGSSSPYEIPVRTT